MRIMVKFLKAGFRGFRHTNTNQTCYGKFNYFAFKAMNLTFGSIN